MIPFSEARRLILENVSPLGRIRRALERADGFVLAEPLLAPFDLPRFDNSAMDGFGVHCADLADASREQPVALRCVGVIRAGDGPDTAIQKGKTVRILTGAPVPPGVDAVVMQEWTEETTEESDGMPDSLPLIRFFKPVSAGDNIRRQGEEFASGEEVLPSGCAITPPVVGLLATLGHATVTVYRKPHVGLISTGNELVRPGKPLQPGQIYDSNTYALSAALKAAGIENIRVYRARDERVATRNAFEKALKENDAVISLGGVSVGAFDFVKDVVERLDVRTVFWRIAIKPGKPVYFGMAGRKPVFGLPGNPVSALVTYCQLVQPALLKMSGVTESNADGFSGRLSARLSGALRKKPGRQEFVRAVVRRGEDGALSTEPVKGQDSHMLGGLAMADGLIDFPLEAAQLDEGAPVDVDLLPWSFFRAF